MIKSLHEKSIETRLRIVFLPILMGSIFLITIVASNITRKIIIEKSSQDVKYKLELIATNINRLTEEAESCANTVIINVDNYTRLGSISNSSLVDVQNILYALKKSKIIFSRINEITYVSNDGDYITEILSKYLPMVGNIKEDDLFKKIQNFEEYGGWISVSKNHILTADSGQNYLTYVKKIRNISTADDLGYVVINIYEKNLYDVYNETSKRKDISYKIIDGTNTIISSDIREEISARINPDSLFDGENLLSDRVIIDKEMMLINSKNIENTDWKVISLIPVKELTRDVDKMTYTIIFIGALVCFIALICTMKLSQTITKPLTDLTNHIKNLKDGHLIKSNIPDRVDEIGILNKSFNNLIDRNNKLLKKININEKKKREYELALLQAQIKPHFLYNTLDIICRLAALGRHQEVIEATKNIANFFRIALSKGDEIIPLKRELELVEHYLAIQKIRYPDILDFNVKMMLPAGDITIPKFTLQPLVENAIYHGLKAKNTKGIIKITGSYDKGDFIIHVCDNGIGMNQEQVEQAFSKSTDMNLTKSYGLINIDERLKLYYGTEYGIRIESTPGVGTTVSVKFRLNEKVIAHA